MKKKLSALLLLILLLAISTNTFAQDGKTNLTAEQIIEKHIVAVGGKETLSKFKTRVAEGTVTKDNENARVYFMSEAPNRITGFYQFEKFNWQLTFDGSKGIFRPLVSSGAYSIFADKYQQLMGTGFMFNSISLYNLLIDSQGQSFKAKGTKKIKNKEHYVIEVKPKKGDVIKLYFDAGTFMWTRTEYGKASYSKPQGGFTNDVVNKSEDDITVEYYFETSDFRDVDGVKLPFKFEQRAIYPIITQTKVGSIRGTITSYKHNIPIDETMFQ